MAAAFPRKVLGSGPSSLEVSAQGFGCMGITAFYGKPIPDEDAVELLTEVYKRGVTHWDTAEVYVHKSEDGPTKYNEDVVGKAIAAIGERDKLEIATKYMPTVHSMTEMTSEMVLAACRASCGRLGVDYVDLYYVHRLHPDVPVEDQARAMQAVVSAGLARRIGVSEFSPRNLRAFHAICPVTCVQQEWSLMNRDLEEDLVPVCRELGIGIVAYSPLCRKLLSGTIAGAEDLAEGDMRAQRYGRFKEENLSANAKLAQRVAALAEERGLSPSQLSLAWVASQGADVCPIPGTTKVAHFLDNAAAVEVELTEEECALVAMAVPAAEVMGNRFAGETAEVGTYKANI